MNYKNIVLATALMCASNPVLAQQTPREQAQDMLGGVGNYTDNFDLNTVESIVLPYETDTPPETSIDDASMEAAIIERVSGDTTESKVLSDTRDSVINRPEVDIDPNGGLFNRANYADENADELLGGYFESNGGVCETGDFGSVETFQKLCRRYNDTTAESCSIFRNIWVDRFDSYICEAQDSRYLKQCDRTISYSCAPTSLCRQNALTITTTAPSSASHNNNSAYLLHSGVANSGCVQQSFQYDLDISTNFQMSKLVAGTLTYVGYAQLVVNGAVIGTYPSGGTAGELISKNTKISKNVTRYVPTLRVTNADGTFSDTTLSTSCENTNRSALVGQDIIGLINQAAPVGTASPQSGQNTIILRTVSAASPIGSLTLSYDGACCDALQKTLETTCAPVIR